MAGVISAHCEMLYDYFKYSNTTLNKKVFHGESPFLIYLQNLKTK